MKKAKKIIALLLCAVLLIGATVAGTVAYLTSQDTVTNTFTVGKVEITMDESKVDAYGKKYLEEQKTDEETTYVVTENANEAARVDGNQYKLIPGHEYIKDPTIHVASTSEKCWVFVEIANGLSTDGTITMNTGWSNVSGSTTVWMYSTALEAGQSITAFNNFTFGKNASPETYKDAKIEVTAYAVQADGFESAQAAWTATFGAPATEENG